MSASVISSMYMIGSGRWRASHPPHSQDMRGTAAPRSPPGGASPCPPRAAAASHDNLSSVSANPWQPSRQSSSPRRSAPWNITHIASLKLLRTSYLVYPIECCHFHPKNLIIRSDLEPHRDMISSRYQCSAATIAKWPRQQEQPGLKKLVQLIAAAA